jgi:hypothetical protein
MDLGSLYAATAANRAAQSAETAAGRVSSAEEQLAEIRKRHDRLLLANQALWEIVKEKLGVSDADLRERMKELDFSDGKSAGKITAGAADCPDCHRKTPANRHKCMYCGTEIPGPIFGQLG